ncbi:hypothetical protein OK006_6805 [Actinobacteria bacterium OK006]|nr:hypothetical protein OK006_6805 [Actinobacteria bacterium OK006]
MRWTTATSGTSPRVRGAGQLGSLGPLPDGNIPAGAGSSGTGAGGVRAPREHPRGCGEQRGVTSTATPSGGTSPRVRGADVDRPAVRLRFGNIPAGAGSRAGTCGGWPAPREHPRGCGEQTTGSTSTVTLSGTSPRVRGAAHGHRLGIGVAGNIPAGAGSSGCPSTSAGTPREHPRGCGEQRLRQALRAAQAGTSPRARGAVTSSLSDSAGGGNIPAGAGSSRGQPEVSKSSREHPRGCGEQDTGQTWEPPWPGTSPRVRGAASRCR